MGGEVAKVLAKDHDDMKKKFVFQDWKKINEQRAALDRAVQPRHQDLMHWRCIPALVAGRHPRAPESAERGSRASPGMTAVRQ